MKAWLLAAGVVWLVVTVAPRADTPKGHGQGSKEPGLMVKRAQIMKSTPVADLGVARYWAVEQSKEVWSLFVEVSGTIPLHFHPDGVHRMYILEGRLRCTVGKETMEMTAGDYMLIPRGVPHKFEKLGESLAYFVAVDTPPINPANNVWLEPAPKAPRKASEGK